MVFVEWVILKVIDGDERSFTPYRIFFECDNTEIL